MDDYRKNSKDNVSFRNLKKPFGSPKSEGAREPDIDVTSTSNVFNWIASNGNALKSPVSTSSGIEDKITRSVMKRRGNPRFHSLGRITLITSSSPSRPTSSAAASSNAGAESDISSSTNGGYSGLSVSIQRSQFGQESTQSSVNSPNLESTTNQSLPESTKDNLICDYCKDKIQVDLLRALDKTFHPQCFRCCDCDKVLDGVYFLNEERAICELDFYRRLNLICFKCGQPLKNEYIQAQGKLYHPDHFTCTLCSTVFRGDDIYYEQDGRIYCHFHYSKHFAKTCQGCDMAILKKFVQIEAPSSSSSAASIRRSDSNSSAYAGCWHPECYLLGKTFGIKMAVKSSVLVSKFKDKTNPVDLLLAQQEWMEDRVKNLWMTVSGFEDSTASCISSILLDISKERIGDAVDEMTNFVHGLENLIKTIGFIETSIPLSGQNIEMMGFEVACQDLLLMVQRLFGLMEKDFSENMNNANSSNNESFGGKKNPRELIDLVTGIAQSLKGCLAAVIQAMYKLDLATKDSNIFDYGLKLLLQSFDLASVQKFCKEVEEGIKVEACSACHMSIEMQGYYELKDTFKWHENCFTCYRCKKKLQVDNCSCQQLQNNGKGMEMNLSCPDCKDESFKPAKDVGIFFESKFQCYANKLRNALKTFNLSVRQMRKGNLVEPSGMIMKDETMDEWDSSMYEEADEAMIPPIIAIPSPMTPEASKELYFKQIQVRREDNSFLTSDLTGLELFIVKHLSVVHVAPILEPSISLSNLLSLVSAEKQSFWKRLVTSFRSSKSLKKPGKEDGTFGMSLDVLTDRYGTLSDLGYGPKRILVPMFFDVIIQRLLDSDLSIEGIFRRNGQVRAITSISEKLDANPNDVQEILMEETNPIHLAALLKKFLRELPQPLLTTRLHDLFIISQKIPREEDQILILYFATLLLPEVNRNVLEILLHFLRHVSNLNGKVPPSSTGNGATGTTTGNRMDLASLATVIAPNIMRQEKGDVNSYQQIIGVVKSLLLHQEVIWTIPSDIQRLLNDQGPHERPIDGDGALTLLRRYGENRR